MREYLVELDWSTRGIFLEYSQKYERILIETEIKIDYRCYK